MLKTPRSSAATITSGVSFDWIKICAMRPARRRTWLLSSLDWREFRSWARRNLFAAKVAISGRGNEFFSLL